MSLLAQSADDCLSKLDQLEVDLIDMSEWARSNNSRRYAVSMLLQECLALTNPSEEDGESARSTQTISQGAYPQGPPE